MPIFVFDGKLRRGIANSDNSGLARFQALAVDQIAAKETDAGEK